MGHFSVKITGFPGSLLSSNQQPLLSLSQAAAKVGLRKLDISKLIKAGIINNKEERSRSGSITHVEIENFVTKFANASNPLPKRFRPDLLKIRDVASIYWLDFVANVKEIIDGRLKVYTKGRKRVLLALLLVERDQLERTVRRVTVGDKSPQRILTATQASERLRLGWSSLNALRKSGFLSAVGSTKRGAIGFLESDIEEFKRKYIHAGQIKLPPDAGTNSVRFYLNQLGIPSVTAEADNVKKIVLWRRIELLSIPGISLSE